MRLGFDGKRVVQNFTGLGNYSRYVLNALTKYFPANSYHVYSPRIPDKEQAKKLAGIRFSHPVKKKFAGLWRTFSIVSDLKRDSIELYHGLSNEIPVGLHRSKIASVVTIHDLIFLRYPKYYPFIDRQIYKYKFKYACKHADLIIAVSEQTKRDIIQYFDTPDEKIHVVYQGCDPSFGRIFSQEAKQKIRTNYNLPERYLLNVGTIEPRKNLMLIAKALREVPENIHLVVVGKQTAYTEEVKVFLENAGLTERVHFLKNVPFADLPGIYQLSEMFIYPSKFEGFGIPIIEALHSGIPVIGATGSCLEEAGGPDSLYIDPRNSKQLVDTINYLLQNPGLRESMAEKGKQYVSRFNDMALAADLITVYRKAIEDHERRS